MKLAAEFRRLDEARRFASARTCPLHPPYIQGVSSFNTQAEHYLSEHTHCDRQDHIPSINMSTMDTIMTGIPLLTLDCIKKALDLVLRWKLNHIDIYMQAAFCLPEDRCNTIYDDREAQSRALSAIAKLGAESPSVIADKWIEIGGDWRLRKHTTTNAALFQTLLSFPEQGVTVVMDVNSSARGKQNVEVSVLCMQIV